jgi:hypothetical protein
MDTEHSAITEPVRRLEVFTGAGRRRTWRDEDKARLVAEIATSGDSGCAVACPRRCGQDSGDIDPGRHDQASERLALHYVVASAVPNIMQVMWEKVVHLSTVAGMTYAMRASVGEIARTKYGSDLMIEFLERNAEIARREGYGPSDAFLDE